MSKLEDLLKAGLQLVPDAVKVLAENDPRVQAALRSEEQLIGYLVNLQERLRQADGIIQGLVPMVKPSQRSSEVYLNACQYLQDTRGETGV